MIKKKTYFSSFFRESLKDWKNDKMNTFRSIGEDHN